MPEEYRKVESEQADSSMPRRWTQEEHKRFLHALSLYAVDGEFGPPPCPAVLNVPSHLRRTGGSRAVLASHAFFADTHPSPSFQPPLCPAGQPDFAAITKAVATRTKKQVREHYRVLRKRREQRLGGGMQHPFSHQGVRGADGGYRVGIGSAVSPSGVAATTERPPADSVAGPAFAGV